MAYRVDHVCRHAFRYTGEDHRRFGDVCRYLKSTSLLHGANLLSGLRVPQMPMPEKARFPRDMLIDANQLTDVISCHVGWIVNDEIRQLIENLEPKHHQFFRFSIEDGVGQNVPGTYWLLNICTLVDAIDSERSNIKKHMTRRALSENDWDYIDVRDSPIKHVLNKERILGKAIWADLRFSRSRPFISDRFVECYNRLGLSGLHHLSFIKEATGGPLAPT